MRRAATPSRGYPFTKTGLGAMGAPGAGQYFVERLIAVWILPRRWRQRPELHFLGEAGARWGSVPGSCALRSSWGGV